MVQIFYIIQRNGKIGTSPSQVKEEAKFVADLQRIISRE